MQADIESVTLQGNQEAQRIKLSCDSTLLLILTFYKIKSCVFIYILCGQ